MVPFKATLYSTFSVLKDILFIQVYQRHFDFSHFLAFMNNTTMNLNV